MDWRWLFGKTVRRPLPAFRAELEGSPALELFDYWNEKRGARPFPSSKSVDAVDMPADLLPNLLLVEADSNGGYRFRLAGTRMREVFGVDPTGKSLEQILDGADLENARRSYGRVLENARPWLSRVVYASRDRGTFTYQRLTLPIGLGRKPDRLLSGLFVRNDKAFVQDFGILHHNKALQVQSRFEMMLA
ncbi:PAS domain-containing protein [Rhodospirillaceae bacterium KN72]|uniref:PAS domain-containing protein n=1 Tax=Pacificispira spongiicola TaxID=2729598 RepID=A0A7Y0HE98_9PROT|nr:PAS domain-containing protein [Pacificispira spongiicola]NMM44631.1 PAS domain-containing protein [Pacificispira spongiicola]